MSLPRFLERAVDAAAPLVTGLDRNGVRDRLEATSITLWLDRPNEASSASFLLAANLLARLYPRIQLKGPEAIVAKARDEIVAISPTVELVDGEATATLVIEGDEMIAEAGNTTMVFARGWNVYIDSAPESDEPAAVPAALAATVLGVAEIFRFVFADALPRPRLEPQPRAFNLITLGDPISGLPLAAHTDLGTFTLVGAGAIGQATAYTLQESGALGTMLAIDPEPVELSNLQRYVLTHDEDCGALKVNLLAARLSNSDLAVVPIPTEWSVVSVDEQ